VSPACTLSEIETRYRSLLLIHHPDLNRQKGPAVVAQAEQKTRQLNEAMAVLRRQHPSGGVKVSSTQRPSERSATYRGSGTTRTGPYADGVPFTWGPPPPDPNRAYNCPLCGDITETLPEFEDHVARAHNISLDPRSKTKPARKRVLPVGTFATVSRFVIWIAIVLVTVWGYVWFLGHSYGFEQLASIGLIIWLVVVTWVIFSKPRR